MDASGTEIGKNRIFGSAAAWAGVDYCDCGRGRRGDIGCKDFCRELRAGYKGRGVGSAVPIHHRAGDKSGAIYRQSEGWAAGRGGVGNQRLVNEGDWILSGSRRGQRG